MIRKDELTYHLSVDSIVMQELNSLSLGIQNVNVMLGNQNRLERDMLFP